MTDPRLPQPEERDVEQVADPSFDLRRGLITLVIVITVMVVITLICVWLADQ